MSNNTKVNTFMRLRNKMQKQMKKSNIKYSDILDIIKKDK